MTLKTEVSLILMGADLKKVKVGKDGRYTKKTLKYLSDNQIPY